MIYDLGEFRVANLFLLMRAQMGTGRDPREAMRAVRRMMTSRADLLEEPLLGESDRAWVEEVHDALRERNDAPDRMALDLCEFRSGPGGWLGLAATDRRLTAEVRAKDLVVGGFGALRARDGRLSVWPRLFRRVCANGAIMAVGAGDEASCDAATVRHAIDEALETRSFVRATSVLRRAAVTPLDDPLDVLLRAQARTPLDVVDRRWDEAGDRTAWGLVNLVTENAREAATAPERFDLEKDAGRILEVALARSRGRPAPV